jgi:hypothetical protein
MCRTNGHKTRVFSINLGTQCHGGKDSIIGIATCYSLDGLGFKPQLGKDFLFSISVQTSHEPSRACSTVGTRCLP